MPENKQIKISPLMVVVCDDIRHEANGKQMLLGIYTGGISLVVADPSNPIGKVINLSLWLPFVGGEEGIASIELNIFGSATDHPFKLKAGLEFDKTPPPFEQSTFTFGPIPLSVNRGGDISIAFKNELDSEWRVLKTFPVSFISALKATELPGRPPINVLGTVE